MKCEVCGHRRVFKNLHKLPVPVTFVVNYATMERRDFPAGTSICANEVRKLSTVGGGSTSEGMPLVWEHGKIVRADGVVVLNLLRPEGFK